jgi:FlaA1/EpsC-like NDP-sugar epimerase
MVLNGLLLLVLVTASRVSVVVLQRLISGRPTVEAERPVLIYGTGERAAFLLREVLDDPRSLRKPIGFLAEEAEVNGGSLHGLPVFSSAEAANVVRERGVGEILTTRRSEAPGTLGQLAQLGVAVRTARIEFE